MKIKDLIVAIDDGLSDIWKLRARGKRDADRHREIIRQSAKDRLREVISSEDIISTDGNGKKIKIPVKHIEQYRFKNGSNKNNQGVGHGGQDVNPGDTIYMPKEDEDQQAGEKDGSIIYEEFSLDEIIQMMLEDLNLPWLENKPEQTEIETEVVSYDDISKKGLMSNIDIKRTLKENLKRNAASGLPPIIGNFKQDDLRFKTYDIKKDYRSNAAVYLVMDRSGSMTTAKKYIAKSFFFWMVQFIKKKYRSVDIVFIAHDVKAHLCEENEFFNLAEDGGTKCSSGFEFVLNHIKQYHNIDSWNNYVFAISDGDNYGEDNELCVKLVTELLNYVNAIGYGEIILEDNLSGFYMNTADRHLSTLQSIFNKNIQSNKFMSTSISKKDDIYNCLKQFFGLKSEIKK